MHAGVVFRGLWAGQSVAVKKLKHGTRRQVEEFRNEVRVLAQLRHPVRRASVCAERRVLWVLL